MFSSTRAISLDPRHVARRERYHDARGQAAPAGDMAQSSESGRLVEPGAVHRQLCAAAGLEGLSLHGRRRSFASLTEWLEVPAGVVAQLMGHKPSATAEKHYKVRPLDLLRVHHERIEAWILKEAGIAFDPATEAPGLRVVLGGYTFSPQLGPAVGNRTERRDLPKRLAGAPFIGVHRGMRNGRRPCTATRAAARPAARAAEATPGRSDCV